MSEHHYRSCKLEHTVILTHNAVRRVANLRWYNQRTWKCCPRLKADLGVSTWILLGRGVALCSDNETYTVGAFVHWPLWNCSLVIGVGINLRPLDNRFICRFGRVSVRNLRGIVSVISVFSDRYRVAAFFLGRVAVHVRSHKNGFESTID